MRYLWGLKVNLWTNRMKNRSWDVKLHNKNKPKCESTSGKADRRMSQVSQPSLLQTYYPWTLAYYARTQDSVPCRQNINLCQYRLSQITFCFKWILDAIRNFPGGIWQNGIGAPKHVEMAATFALCTVESKSTHHILRNLMILHVTSKSSQADINCFNVVMKHSVLPNGDPYCGLR